jgi:hypothetical protein
LGGPDTCEAFQAANCRAEVLRGEMGVAHRHGQRRVAEELLKLRSSPNLPQKMTASCDALEGDSVALLLERLHGPLGDALGVVAIVVVGPELLVDRLAREDVIGGDE